MARVSDFRITFDEDNTDGGYIEIIHSATEQLYLLGFERSGVLYVAIFQPTIANKALLSKHDRQQILHRRLGHVSHFTIFRTVPILKGVNLEDASKDHTCVCTDCAESNSYRKHRLLTTPESRGATGILDHVHIDIVGPVESSSLLEKKYFITLYGDSSAVSLVRFL